MKRLIVVIGMVLLGRMLYAGHESVKSHTSGEHIPKHDVKPKVEPLDIDIHTEERQRKLPPSAEHPKSSIEQRLPAQPERAKTADEIGASLVSIKAKLNQANAHGKAERVQDMNAAIEKARASIKALKPEDMQRYINKYPNEFLARYANRDFFAILEPDQLKAVHEVLMTPRILGKLQPAERFALLRELVETIKLANVPGWSTLEVHGAEKVKEAKYNDYKALIADILQSLSEEDIEKYFSDSKHADIILGFLELFESIKPLTEQRLAQIKSGGLQYESFDADEKLYVRALDMSLTLVEVLNRQTDPQKAESISTPLMRFIRSLPLKDASVRKAVIDQLNRLDFSKIGVGHPGMYEDILLLFKDVGILLNVVIVQKYLTSVAALNSVEESVRALQFFKKNFPKDRQYIRDVAFLTDPILRKLRSFEVPLDKFQSMIEALEYFTKLQDIISLKFEMAKHITGFGKQQFKKMPAEVLDYVTKTYTELYGIGSGDADVLTWQFLNNLESLKAEIEKGTRPLTQQSQQLVDLYEKVLTLIKPGIFSKKPLDWSRFKAWWNGRQVKGSLPHVLKLPIKAIVKILANLTPEQAHLTDKLHGLDRNKDDFRIFADSFNYFYDNWWKWYQGDYKTLESLAQYARAIYGGYFYFGDPYFVDIIPSDSKQNILKVIALDTGKQEFFYRMLGGKLMPDENYSLEDMYGWGKPPRDFFKMLIDAARSDPEKAKALSPVALGLSDLIPLADLIKNPRFLDNVNDKIFDQLLRPFFRGSSISSVRMGVKINDLEQAVASLSKMENAERKSKLARALYEHSWTYTFYGGVVYTERHRVPTPAEQQTLTNAMDELRAIINSLQPQPAQGQQPQAQG